MEEIIKLVVDYGVLTAIAVVFIWDKVNSGKRTDAILKELQTNAKLQSSTLESLRHTCENLTTAMNIIQNTLYANTQTFDRYDKRADFMNNDIRSILEMVKAEAYQRHMSYNNNRTGGQSDEN